MRKKIFFIQVPFLVLLLVAFVAVFSGCAGSKPAATSETGDMDAIQPSSGLEQSKQDAEAAEWEAHRLREELNRKKKAAN